MPRMISYAETTEQVRRHEKTITRRLGWWDEKNDRPRLKPGERIQAVKKAMGLRKGEKVEVICEQIHKSSRREHLDALLPGRPYSYSRMEACLEVVREGFPGREPEWFVQFYLRDFSMGYEALREKAGATKVNRIEFEYVEEHPSAGSGIMGASSFQQECSGEFAAPGA